MYMAGNDTNQSRAGRVWKDRYGRKGKERREERREDNSVYIWPETIQIRVGLKGYGMVWKDRYGRKGKERREGKEGR